MDLPVIHADARHTVYQTADGSQLPIVNPPADLAESQPDCLDHCAGLVSRSTAAFAQLDAARRRAGEDQSLSDLGRLEKVAPLRQQVEKTLSDAQTELDTFGAYIVSFEAKTFAPPVLEPTDAVSALADMEIRQHLRGLPVGGRKEAFNQIAASPRLMAAVLRSPVPMADFSDLAARTWRAHVEVTSPDAPKVAAFRAAHEWAGRIIPQLLHRARQP